MWLPAVGTLFLGAFCAVCASALFPCIYVQNFVHKV